MTQRISLTSWLGVSLWLACCIATVALAQDTKNTFAPLVAAAATTEQARFLADNEVTNIRLVVFTLSDTRLYDSEFKAGNLLDWNWQDAQGQRLADGAYRCVVTVKDLTGHATQRQGLLLVQNGAAVWQAPKQAEAALRNTAVAESIAYFATVTNPTELTAAVLAHDGTDARLMTGSGGLSVRTGNFLKGEDQEKLRLTAEGKLEVKGAISTGEGVVFPDGTVQKTAYVASGQTLKQIAEDGKKLSPNAPTVGGSGTPNVLMKWAANGVDATNSSVTDNGPGGGITVNGGVQSTFYEASASGTFLSFKPAILGSAFLLRSNSLSGNIWIGHLGNVGLNASDPGSRFATGGNATIGNAYYNTAAPTNGLLVEGNVGIGTATPLAKFHVNGSSWFQGDTTPLPAAAGKGVVVGFSGEQGYISAFDYGASTPKNLLLNLGGGNVGIGTTTPLSKLSVGGGGYGLTHTAGAVTLGTFVTTAAGGSGGIGTQSNHPLNFFTNNSASPQMTLDINGNFGIGTFPTTKLHVLNSTPGFSAIYGESASGPGVYGKSTSSRGVFGESTSFVGVWGKSTSNSGVYGESPVSSLTAGGVYGKGTGSGSIGVIGESNIDNAVGVFGVTASVGGFGGYFRNTGGGKSLIAEGTASIGVLEISGGSDLAEKFEVADEPKPGMIVAIDPKHNGRLSISHGA